MKSDYSEKYIRLGLKIAYYRKLRQGSEAAGRLLTMPLDCINIFADFTISNRFFSMLWYTI